MSIVADNVERIVKECGYKKGAVAAKAGFKANDFSAMLHGRKQILAEHVISLARALDTTPNELYGFVGETDPSA